MITMDFSEALRILKRGTKVKRLNWNGKGQYLEIGHSPTYLGNDDIVHYTCNDVIVFHGTNNVQVGWLATQSDILSDDWIEVEE